jgi:hypothetical protein
LACFEKDDITVPKPDGFSCYFLPFFHCFVRSEISANWFTAKYLQTEQGWDTRQKEGAFSEEKIRLFHRSPKQITEKNTNYVRQNVQTGVDVAGGLMTRYRRNISLV